MKFGPNLGRLFGAGLLALSVSGTAMAQPASDPQKEKATARFKEGLAALDASRWDEARAAFSEAYALTGSAAVLLNLGVSEVRGGKTVEGCNHLVKFLREHKAATSDNKDLALATIDECKKKASMVTVRVDVSGADVNIDGASLGRSPLANPTFVEPGARVATATLGDKTGATRWEAIRGQATNITVIVNLPLGTRPPGDPTPPPVGPTNPPGPSPTGTPLEGNGTQPPPPPPETAQHGQSFGSWFVESPVAWIGTGLFAAGLGVGISFTVLSSQSKDDTEKQAAIIAERAAQDGLKGAPCSSTGTADAYPGECQTLRDGLAVHDINVGVSIGGWALAGAAAIGTVTYILVDWVGNKRGGSSERASAPGGSVMVIPVVSPDTQGAAVIGTF